MLLLKVITMNRFYIYSLIATILYFTWDLGASHGGEYENKILQEASIKWREYLEFGKKYKGKQSELTSQFNNHIWSQDSFRESEWKSNGVYSISIEKSFLNNGETTPETEFVTCGNPEYVFHLSKGKNRSGYVLDSVNLSPGNNDDITVGIPAVAVRKIYKTYFVSPLFFSNFSLLDLVNDKKFNFMITGSFTEDPINKEYIQIPFKFQHQASPTVQFVLQGVLILDPSNYWIIRSVNYEIKRSSSKGLPTKCQVEYSYKSCGGLMVLEKTVEIRKTPASLNKEAQELKIETNYDIKELSNPDPADYYLSAFGFPEPQGFNAPRKTNLGGLALLFGFAILCIVTLIAWIRRHGFFKKSGHPIKLVSN